MDQTNQKPKLLNVTDLSMYLYCPRKFYLEKVKGLKQPPSKVMIEGRIRHQVLEDFSNKEKDLVESFSPELHTKDKIISIYNQFITKLINYHFLKSRSQILAFKISPESLQQKIITSMNNDILLRADSIILSLQKGLSGESLWENLEPKYLSEFSLESQTLGLKGRVDRIMITNEEIIPFELKTREIEKVFPSDEIQLTAYAMLLEEEFSQNIPIGILESGNIKHEIKITSDNKKKVHELIKEINSLTNPKFPSNFSKCRVCNHQKECDELK